MKGPASMSIVKVEAVCVDDELEPSSGPLECRDPLDRAAACIFSDRFG